MTKEADKVRMIGVLPSQDADPIPVGKIPDLATQVSKDGLAENQTTLIHQVTTATTFYLCSIAMSSINLSGAVGSAILQVTTGLDVERYRFFDLACPDDDGKGLTLTFFPPLEIAAADKINVVSPLAAFYVRGYIFGYEV